MSITVDTVQDPMSWLKADASEYTDALWVTLDKSQDPAFWLKVVASLNMVVILDRTRQTTILTVSSALAVRPTDVNPQQRFSTVSRQPCIEIDYKISTKRKG
jgi:hypothetical protein